MTLDPLSIHNHFKPVEVKVNSKVDWDDFATMDDFLNEIVTPRTDKMKTMAEAWECRLLEEAYRLCAWRLSYVSWYEWGDYGICHCCARIWPAWQTKEALKFAREKGERVVTLNFKKWLIMSDDEFFCETHGSANYETALKLRKLLQPIVRRKCKCGIG